MKTMMWTAGAACLLALTLTSSESRASALLGAGASQAAGMSTSTLLEPAVVVVRRRPVVRAPVRRPVRVVR